MCVVILLTPPPSVSVAEFTAAFEAWDPSKPLLAPTPYFAVGCTPLLLPPPLCSCPPPSHSVFRSASNLCVWCPIALASALASRRFMGLWRHLLWWTHLRECRWWLPLFLSQPHRPLALSPCRCASCGAPGVVRCGRCRKVRYCSAACQGAHWKAEHKRTCNP